MISWGNFLQVENGTLFNDNWNCVFSVKKTVKKTISFLFAEIPYRKFIFFYSLRNEFLRSENEFHRFLFSKKMNLPEKIVKFSKNG